MYKSTIEITNKGLGFKLTNSMSFGESVISAGFIQKTIKGNLFVKKITELCHGIYVGRI
jgi:hypothetical protein